MSTSSNPRPRVSHANETEQAPGEGEPTLEGRDGIEASAPMRPGAVADEPSTRPVKTKTVLVSSSGGFTTEAGLYYHLRAGERLTLPTSDANELVKAAVASKLPEPEEA